MDAQLPELPYLSHSRLLYPHQQPLPFPSNSPNYPQPYYHDGTHPPQTHTGELLPSGPSNILQPSQSQSWLPDQYSSEAKRANASYYEDESARATQTGEWGDERDWDTEQAMDTEPEDEEGEGVEAKGFQRRLGRTQSEKIVSEFAGLRISRPSTDQPRVSDVEKGISAMRLEP